MPIRRTLEAAPPSGSGSAADLELVPPLPRDHPAWARDGVALSSRARALLAKLVPLAIVVRTFWDHAVRTIALHGELLIVDSAGSYCLDY
ncbi:MAG: hypothetical protein JOZ38_03810 [Candidatus Eremiobacteraeota bacterium]|nr:hypothetical protein [Candidatus Eremiobacteraeota bacterium]